MDTTTMRERIKETAGYLDIEAGVRAAIADATGWHHADLRGPEEEWLDRMTTAVADAAIGEALGTAEKGLEAVLRLAPAHLSADGINAALRADIAALEARS